MKNLTLVSVIVPVFNNENYLEACLNSIMGQTYNNLEIIIIDDGSSDSSANMVDDFASKDGRFIVRHQKNQGVSSARNSALNIATGDWIMFVDSDDILPKNSIKTLLDIALKTDSDLVSGVYESFSKDVELKLTNFNKNKSSNCILGTEDAISDMLYQRKIANAPFSKLYKSQVVANVRFDEAISVSEDLLFNYMVLKNCSKIAVTDEVIYFYRNNPYSVINKPFSPKRMTGLQSTNMILADARNSNLVVLSAINRCFMEAIYILSQIKQKKINQQSYDECMKVVKDNRKTVFRDSMSPLVYRVIGFLSLMSPAMAVFLYKLKIVFGLNAKKVMRKFGYIYGK